MLIYPILNEAYSNFINFSQSSSNSFTDWYSDKSGYRNTSKIYFPTDDTFTFGD